MLSGDTTRHSTDNEPLMSKRIPGQMDIHALAMLARPEVQHRPADPALLAREARRLADEGLTPRDIAAALRLAPAAVGALLASDDRRQLPGCGE